MLAEVVVEQFPNLYIKIIDEHLILEFQNMKLLSGYLNKGYMKHKFCAYT